MDVKVFKTFLEVAEVRHFGRAAESLYLTQAAVSARIKQLESYFDVVLFSRDRNNIRLTPAGERLLEYAEIMVTTLEQAKLALAVDTIQKAQMTIGGTINVWDAYLQSHFSIVTKAFYDHTFNTEAMTREMLKRSLIDRNLDLAFVFDPFKSEELICQKIASVHFILVSAFEIHNEDRVVEGSVIEESAVENNVVRETHFNDRYIYVDWGDQFAQEHALRHPDWPSPYVRTSSGKMALELILEQGGSAYLPYTMVKPLLQSKQLFQVHDIPDWCASIYLCYRKNGLDSDAVALIEQMASNFCDVSF